MTKLFCVRRTQSTWLIILNKGGVGVLLKQPHWAHRSWPTASPRFVSKKSAFSRNLILPRRFNTFGFCLLSALLCSLRIDSAYRSLLLLICGNDYNHLLIWPTSTIEWQLRTQAGVRQIQIRIRACASVTCFCTFIPTLAARNSPRDPVALTCGGCHDKLRWYIILACTWASWLWGVTWRHHFWGWNYPIFFVRFHLFFCPVWSGALVSSGLSKAMLNTHYSSIPSVCVCPLSVRVIPNEGRRRFKVTTRTGGQSGLCQRWRIVTFDDVNKVKPKREGGRKRERERGQKKRAEFKERQLKKVDQRETGRWALPGCLQGLVLCPDRGWQRRWVHPARRMKASVSAHRHLVDFAKSCTTTRDLS